MMKTLFNFVFSITLLFFFSCKEKNEEVLKNVLFEEVDNSKNLIVDTANVPENLRQIVKMISNVNYYHDGTLAKGETKAENFENFKILKSLATENELLELTNNRNKTVAVYASIALLPKNSKEIYSVFQKLLSSNSKVYTQYGCLVGFQNLAEPMYNAYERDLKDIEKDLDTQLYRFDSLIIFNQNSSEELLYSAFRNRIYPDSYKKQIEKIAFIDNKVPAIFYLSKWNKAEFSNQLQAKYVEFIQNDTIQKNLKDKYFMELLSFENPKNKKLILNYFKKDTLLKNDYNVISKLESNGVYSTDY